MDNISSQWEDRGSPTIKYCTGSRDGQKANLGKSKLLFHFSVVLIWQLALPFDESPSCHTSSSYLLFAVWEYEKEYAWFPD